MELAKIEKAIAAMISAIEESLYQLSMKARMDELERQKANLMDRLAGAPADVPDILPNVSAVYRKKVQRLAAALSDPNERAKAAEAIRGLIERITLRQGPIAEKSTRPYTANCRRLCDGLERNPLAQIRKPTFP